MPSATSRVLAMPELLEKILLHADEHAVLRAMSVSQAFAAQIKSSINIQRKLCFQPYTKTLAYPLNNGEELVPQVLINPFLLDSNEAIQVDNPVEPACLVGESLLYFDVKSSFGSKKMSKDASCRRMLLCQPAVEKIKIEIFYPENYELSKIVGGCPRSGEDYWYNTHKIIKNREGVRIGDVLAMIEKCRLAGRVDNFYFEMGVDVDEAQADEIVGGEAKEDLVAVDVSDERLLQLDISVTVAPEGALEWGPYGPYGDD